jgi:peptide/nickel transport system permease protein
MTDVTTTATADLTGAAPPQVAPPPVAPPSTAVTARRGSARTHRRRWPVSLWFGTALLGLLLFLAVFGELLVDSPTSQDIASRLLPAGTGGHLLGTDGLGRDMLARLVDGVRPSLIGGVVPVIIAGTVGTTLGMSAALSGRLLHSGIMRVLDVFYAFPAVLLAVGIAAALGNGIPNVIVALSVAFVPPVARVVETEVLRLRDADFMASARASGAGRVAIALRQVLPNITAPLLVYCTALTGLSVVYAAGLSFLGLGVAPPNPEWGLMVDELRQYIYTNPELALEPALALLVASVAFNLAGVGLRDHLDARRVAR